MSSEFVQESGDGGLQSRVNRISFVMQLLAYRRGLLWLIAPVLLVAAVGVGMGVAVFVHAHLIDARAAIAEQRQLLKRGGSSRTAARRLPEQEALEELDRVLPAEESLETQVRALYVLAANAHMLIGEAQFSAARDPETGLRRLEITLPVNGRYSQLREFIDTALHELPNLSLDEIGIVASKSAGAALDAKLHLSLWGKPAGGTWRGTLPATRRFGGAS